MKKPYVSIIIPVYKPNKTLLDNIIKNLKNQETNFKFEVIKIAGNNGLANAYNQGIRKSKGEIIVTLHQDCVPGDTNWLAKMVLPFKNPNVVLATSKVLENESLREYFPYPPDGKSTAYRKNVLIKVRGFDEKTYFTGGEDVDIYLKMIHYGKLKNVNTFVEHVHKGYLGNKTIEKIRQNASINGSLFRIWGVRNPKWWKALIMCFRYPREYGANFLRAFINKKQSYRRND